MFATLNIDLGPFNPQNASKYLDLQVHRRWRYTTHLWNCLIGYELFQHITEPMQDNKILDFIYTNIPDQVNQQYLFQA